MSDLPDLRKHLLDAVEITGEREHWSITSDEEADWALRKQSAAEREISRIRRMAQTEIDRIQAWAADAEAGPEHDRAFFAGKLTEYRMACEQANPKLPKTYKLPSGTLSVRAGRDSVKVIDEAAFLAWAEQSCPEAIKRTALTSPLDKVNGQALYGGEPVPGVEVVTSPAKYQSTPAADLEELDA